MIDRQIDRNRPNTKKAQRNKETKKEKRKEQESAEAFQRTKNDASLNFFVLVSRYYYRTHILLSDQNLKKQCKMFTQELPIIMLGLDSLKRNQQTKREASKQQKMIKRLPDFFQVSTLRAENGSFSTLQAVSWLCNDPCAIWAMWEM